MRQSDSFHPRKRTILLCDFDRIGFAPPEMTKRRRIVVLRTFGPIALIVPLSATAPRPIRPYHTLIDGGPYASLSTSVWAKCNMLTHVAITRLERVRALGRLHSERLGLQDFRRILNCVAHAAGTRLDMDGWSG
jgi:uncharacterized protein YifN (PemK superfamily)